MPTFSAISNPILNLLPKPFWLTGDTAGATALRLCSVAFIGLASAIIPNPISKTIFYPATKAGDLVTSLFPKKLSTYEKRISAAAIGAVGMLTLTTMMRASGAGLNFKEISLLTAGAGTLYAIISRPLPR